MTNNDFNELLYQVACEIAEMKWRSISIFCNVAEEQMKKDHKLYTLDDLTKAKQKIYIEDFSSDNTTPREHRLYTVKENGEVQIHIDNYKCSYMIGSAFYIAREFELLVRPKAANRVKFGMSENGVRIAKVPSIIIGMAERGQLVTINDDAHIAPKIKPEAASQVVIPVSTSYDSVAYRYYEKAKAHAPKDSMVLVYHTGYIYFFGDDAHKALIDDVKRMEKKLHEEIEIHLNKYSLNLQDKNINLTYRRYDRENPTIIEECIANSERKYVLYEYGTLYDFTNLCRHYKENKIGDLKRRAQEAREASLIAGNETKTKTITKTKEESIAGAYLFLFFFEETAEQEAA